MLSYINHKVLRLPQTIGLLIMSLVATLMVLAVGRLVPGWDMPNTVSELMVKIDFRYTLLQGMLGFLLFAGALHVDIGALKRRAPSIAAMATIGVILSTLLVGGGLYLVTQALSLGVPFLICLVFGALIAPTDPIAVLGVLKTVRVPRDLQAKIAGESLFNDGVGVVIFSLVVAVAFRAGQDVTAGTAIGLFALEALGGAALGAVAGYIVQRALRGVTDPIVQVLMTLGLAAGVYALAGIIHVSPLIAVVLAGLLIGNSAAALHHAADADDVAKPEKSESHDPHSGAAPVLFQFWMLVDEILNAVLFLLIGLQVIVVQLNIDWLLAAALAIPIVLIARFASVGLTIVILDRWRDFTKGAIRVLTWGGLRGGISVALALALPPSPHKDLILTLTYVVVVFSIIVQGLTIAPLVRRVVPRDAE